MSDELDFLRAGLWRAELHITRASQWTDADQHPITRAEWESFAEAHPKLSQHGSASWKGIELNQDGSVGSVDIGTTPIYSFTCKDGAEVRLSWRDDHVKAWGELLGHEAALATLAVQFRARLLGDDEEEYLPNGTRVPWDEFRKPITPLGSAVTRSGTACPLRARQDVESRGIAVMTRLARIPAAAGFWIRLLRAVRQQRLFRLLSLRRTHQGRPWSRQQIR